MSASCARRAFLPDTRRPPETHRPDAWPRLRVAEATALLIAARLLVWLVPMRFWRGSLGRAVTDSPDQPVSGKRPALGLRRLSRAVARAAQHLPGTSKCLPQAMAMQWMLRRRGIGSALVFGILPANQRDHADALHAWVEIGDTVVIGERPGLDFRRSLALVQP